MATALGTAIDQDLKDILQALSFSGIDSANVKIRELPKVGEVIDVVPCVVIGPYGKDKSEPMGTEGSSGRVHAREVCLIDGHEGDFASDKPKRELWLQQAMNGIEKVGDEFRTSLPSVPKAWSVEIDGAATFDRAKLNQNYAYQSIVVLVRTVE